MGPQALLLLMPLVILLALPDRRIALRLAVLVALGIAIGSLRASSMDHPVAFLGLERTTAATGEITTVPVAGGDFERAILSLESVQARDGSWREAHGDVIVYLPDSGPGVSLHDTVFVAWQVSDADTLSPGYARYVRTQGAVASGRVYAYQVDEQGPAFFAAISDVRRETSRLLQVAFEGDAGALAAGIVTGDDSAMSESAENAFRRTGTAHITAVSGQNVSLLIAFLSLWMRPSGRWQRILSHAGLIVAVWSFAIMVGLEPPALRASVVATLTILGAWSGRRPDPLTLLALALGGMAIIDPQVTRSVGFWLSAFASSALCSVVQPVPPEGLAAKAVNLAMGPLAASLGTLPVILWTFGEWSPVSPLANALLTPLMSLMFPVAYGFAMLAMIWEPLASMLAWLPAIGFDLALSIVERMAAISPQVHLDTVGAPGAVLVAIPAVALLLAWSRDGRRWARVLASRW